MGFLGLRRVGRGMRCRFARQPTHPQIIDKNESRFWATTRCRSRRGRRSGVYGSGGHWGCRRWKRSSGGVTLLTASSKRREKEGSYDRRPYRPDDSAKSSGSKSRGNKRITFSSQSSHEYCFFNVNRSRIFAARRGVPRMARKLDLSETAGDNPWRGR